MVIDKISNYKLYIAKNSKLEKAFDFIKGTDLNNLPIGKYEIDKDIYAIVMEYETQNEKDCVFERHTKHIDLQYIISGSELVGFTTYINQEPIEVNDKDDYYLYKLNSNLLKFEKGMFTLFFPDDIHMPGVSSNEDSNIKKIVLKIKV